MAKARRKKPPRKSRARSMTASGAPRPKRRVPVERRLPDRLVELSVAAGDPLQPGGWAEYLAVEDAEAPEGASAPRRAGSRPLKKRARTRKPKPHGRRAH